MNTPSKAFDRARMALQEHFPELALPNYTPGDSVLALIHVYTLPSSPSPNKLPLLWPSLLQCSIWNSPAMLRNTEFSVAYSRWIMTLLVYLQVFKRYVMRCIQLEFFATVVSLEVRVFVKYPRLATGCKIWLTMYGGMFRKKMRKTNIFWIDLYECWYFDDYQYHSYY